MKTTQAKPETKPKNSLIELFYQRHFRLNLMCFIVFNLLLYVWLSFGRSLVPFNRINYISNARHHVTDSRLSNPNSFNLLRALGQYDAQWYLKIADAGYPNHPPPIELNNGRAMNGLSYTFPPAYPLIVSGVNLVINSVEISAFIVTQLILILGFSLIYWLITRWYTPDLAAKTAWLVFLSPFSIFYRSYFAEGLFLILLIILMDALRSKKWFRATLAAGWLAVTRFIGVFGIISVIGLMFMEYKKGELKLFKLLQLSLVAILPPLIFVIFCTARTGDPLYFINIRSTWISGLPPPPFSTLWSIGHFFDLPWHLFHLSRIDIISIFLSGGLVYFSRKWLPRSWWYLALFLWLLPIMTADTMSASRYQIVNLPLFLYVAHILSSRWYKVVVVVSTMCLLVLSIGFINWVWIG